MLLKAFPSVLLFHAVSAWDKDGHDAVGGTAMSMLDTSVSSKLKGILGGDDASDVAGWAHRIEKSLGWTSTVHFMAQANDWSCTAPSTTSTGICPDGRCLETAIRHFYRQLTRGESIPGINVMKSESDFTDSDALRFIINLAGDLSQSLHVGFKSNNFGKGVFVKLPPGIPVGANDVVSLFDLWDSKISQNIINNPYAPNFWWGGWTHYRNLNPEIVEREQKVWKEKGIDAVSDWLNESTEYVCSKIYTNPVTKEKLVLSSDIKTPTSIPLNTYKQWEQAVRERILLGGVRLGILLNAILTNPDAPSASKLRRGSAVRESEGSEAIVGNVLDDLDDRGQASPGSTTSKKVPKTGINAGILNVAILGGFAIIILIVIKMSGQTDSNPFAMAKTHVVEMTGLNGKQVRNTHKD